MNLASCLVSVPAILGDALLGCGQTVVDRETIKLNGTTFRIRRRTRVVGAFPDGNSALNLAAARLRHIAGTL